MKGTSKYTKSSHLIYSRDATSPHLSGRCPEKLFESGRKLICRDEEHPTSKHQTFNRDEKFENAQKLTLFPF